MLEQGYASPFTLVARLATNPALFLQGHESLAAVLGKATPSPSPTLSPASDAGILTATWVTAIATAGLFLGAIVTAIYAVMAYRAQAREINLMGQQRDEQRALTRQQIDLLQLQAQALRAPRAAAPPRWIANLVSFVRLILGRAYQERRHQEPELEAPAEVLPSTRESSAERPSTQAREVLAWQEHTLSATRRRPTRQQQMTVNIENAGTEPVYDVQVRWHPEPQPAGTRSRRAWRRALADFNAEPPPTPDRIGILSPGDQLALPRQVPIGDRYTATVTFRDSQGRRWAREPATGEVSRLPSGDTRQNETDK